jgi:enoyl-CoA hydratase/carnithine racemase
MSSGAEPGILIEREGALATVVLSNPGKLNALTAAMWRSLRETMESLSARDELRCIVLRAVGQQAFAAGADIEEFQGVRANSIGHASSVTHHQSRGK